MSLAVEAVSSSSNMGFHENKEGEEKSTGGLDTATTELTGHESDDEEEERLGFVRKTSESSLYMTEDEEDEEGSTKIELGPQCSLKDQLEKDKDDESLRKWKEQLLGNVDVNNIGETLDPEVKILSLSILSPDRPVIVLAIPEGENPKGLWFTLKEGSRYSLKFSFQVSNNIVSGLRYTSTVWKTGVKVDSTNEMLGTFCPQPEPYMHVMPEDTTPSGIFARGQYSAKLKFLDDDNNCYLEINYTFDIRKGWAST
ncbi:putative Rho GDP-dissociation inhibitor [Tripterygium wilfordii]|uniref:Putative Rho GDP-dissociation inhibitor n=1 Tax=Tripterygium wilfordii TaxID=458696 RepID=A0A7J7DIE1_TRIWF|nr:rho GDP-dissociation inhibitor 1-like [Tripterygium wilfordii]KAF5746135.1 putative Rho GDP-dissociation inhibitor [Tripterygium wilfordii]